MSIAPRGARVQLQGHPISEKALGSLECNEAFKKFQTRGVPRKGAAFSGRLSLSGNSSASPPLHRPAPLALPPTATLPPSESAYREGGGQTMANLPAWSEVT